MICLTLVLLKKKFTLSLLSLTIALSKQMKSKVEQTIITFFQLQHKLIMIILKHHLDQINNSKQKKSIVFSRQDCLEAPCSVLMLD